MAYSLDFKKKVVNEFRTGKTITEISDKYNIAPSTVFFWNKYIDGNAGKYKTYGKHGNKSYIELVGEINELKEKVSSLEEKLEKISDQINK